MAVDCMLTSPSVTKDDAGLQVDHENSQPNEPGDPRTDTPGEDSQNEQAETAFEELVDNLNPVADLGETFRKLQSRYLIAMLASYFVSATIAVTTVLMNPVPDWLLFPGMYLVIFSYIILYLKAHQRRHRFLRSVSFVASEFLLAYWVFILIDRIPARKVFLDQTIVERPDMPGLWVSAGLLTIAALILLTHWAYLSRKVDWATTSNADASTT